MIQAADSLPSLLTSLQTFMMMHGSTLPEHTRTALLSAASNPSPVDRIVESAEALYAIKTALPKEGREVAAQLAMFAGANGFHNMTDRGFRMARAFNRIGGYAPPEGQAWPTADEDPKPLDRYLETSTNTDDVATPPADSAG